VTLAAALAAATVGLLAALGANAVAAGPPRLVLADARPVALEYFRG
jgi:hypothetical protein